MNITFITTGLDYGGAETQLVRLAVRLKTRGWRVRVVSMLPPQAYTEELEAAGIPVDSLNMRRGVPDPRAVLKLAALLRRERPTILHSHMVHANLLARVTRILAPVPLVISSARNIQEGGRWREWAYALTDFLCDLTTQVSRAGLERYIRIGATPANKIRFIPNGVDIQRFRSDPTARLRLRKEMGLTREFLWLAVGRFEAAKDHPVMLKAFAQTEPVRRDSILALVGQGSLKAQAEGIAVEMGLRSRVRFLGMRRDIPDLLSAADAYVMSSAWEGMPNVLLEAAATGLPIVATDVGGNREVVLNGESGFLVPPRNPAALAEAMLRLMELPPATRHAMGRRGRVHIEAHYSLDRVVDQWEALYRELLEARRRNSKQTYLPECKTS